MSRAARKAALERAEALLGTEIRPQAKPAPVRRMLRIEAGARNGLSQKLRYAGLPASPLPFIAACIISGSAAAWLCSLVLSSLLIPLYGLAGLYLPFLYLGSRTEKRTAAFAADYPTVLMATASSIKAGLTPLFALRRSIKLLPKTSVMRVEVERLVSNLEQGMHRRQALENFAADIDQPDLELFRTGFALVMENGGRFSPTLERLALVCRSRETLISSAMVSTASMRMTANILVCIAPALLVMISGRIPNFWELFRNHPTANTIASVGIVMITGSYLILRRLSAFKP